MLVYENRNYIKTGIFFSLKVGMVFCISHLAICFLPLPNYFTAPQDYTETYKGRAYISSFK